MKTKIAITFLIYFSTFIKFTFAQVYTPIQFGNTRWMYNQQDFFFTQSYCYFSKDTNGYYFGGNKFWRIEHVNSPIYSPTSNGMYLFDDSLQQKVFFIDTNTNIVSLLYDFSANVGDTINNVLNIGGYNDVIVDSIKFILLNGINRKHMFVHPVGLSFLQKVWIAGIGSTNELFSPSFIISDPVYILVCHQSNAYINYGDSVACSNFLTGIPDIEKNKIKLHYNHYTNTFQIDNKNENTYTLVLTNITGSKILEKQSKKISENINISFLPNSIYFYSIILNNENLQNGKVLKSD